MKEKSKKEAIKEIEFSQEDIWGEESEAENEDDDNWKEDSNDDIFVVGDDIYDLKGLTKYHREEEERIQEEEEHAERVKRDIKREDDRNSKVKR